MARGPECFVEIDFSPIHCLLHLPGNRVHGHGTVAVGLLDVRRGQTELSVAMADMAGITPAITICEMLDDVSGYALSKADAKKYAKKHGLEFVEGPEVLEAWEQQKSSRE
jgi:3,4-dihydroxy-2-butanone 4-phosphate synthase